MNGILIWQKSKNGSVSPSLNFLYFWTFTFPGQVLPLSSSGNGGSSVYDNYAVTDLTWIVVVSKGDKYGCEKHVGSAEALRVNELATTDCKAPMIYIYYHKLAK